MLSWKDKVSEKLSRLFYDSTTSQSPPLDQSQAGQDSKEDKSFSSMFSFILPSTSSDGFTPVKDRHENEPIQSLPVKWESGNISWRDNHFGSYDECDHECENKGTPNSHEFYQEHGSGWSTEHEKKGALNTDEDRSPRSGRSTSSSDAFEDATDSHNVEKSIPYLTEDSFFISSDLHEFLQASLPNIVKGCQWILLYRAVL